MAYKVSTIRGVLIGFNVVGSGGYLDFDTVQPNGQRCRRRVTIRTFRLFERYRVRLGQHRAVHVIEDDGQKSESQRTYLLGICTY